MGPAKVINLDDDDELDDRAKRRLRRRYAANGIYKPELFHSTPEKSTRCNAQAENPLADSDYERYLSKLERGQIGHSGDHIDIWSSDGGDDDRGNVNCGPEDDVRMVVEDSDDSSEHCGEEDGDGGNVHSGDADINNRSVSDGDGNIHGNSLNDGVVDDDMDPQYKMFWDNLRADGNSYVLQIVLEDGCVKQIRYHQGDGLPDEVVLDTMQSVGKEKIALKNRETLENVVKAPVEKSSVKKRKVKLEAPEPISDGTNMRSSKRPCIEVSNTPANFLSPLHKEKTETRRNLMKKRNLEDYSEKMTELEKKSSMVKKSVKEADTDPFYGRTNGRSHKQSGSKYLPSPEGGCNNEVESDSNLTDDNYQEFLSCTKVDDKGMVFTSRICGPLRYDSDEESSSDSDVVVLDRDLHEGNSTPIKMYVDSRRSTESHSQFRQGIMQDLERPYDPEEYIDLLEDWSRQRPPKGHAKNFRNGSIKTYGLEGEFGKSYQETHKDVARKMDAVAGDDRPKKLNLLRGFFYWLKNISQQGSFKPWNDKACLKVLPQEHK